jgi:hypothetical protein
VALYLALTVAPLAVASPFLVFVLDRGGFLRLISFSVSAGRAILAVYAAPRFDSLLLFPLAFGLLVLSKANGIAKNALTTAYAPSTEGLVETNARLGRLSVVGGLLAAGPGVLLLKIGGAQAVLYLACAAFATAMLLTLRLHRPRQPRRGRTKVEGRGRMPALSTAAAGTAGLKAGSGFLFFLLAFALRGGDKPAYWFGLLIGAAALGGFLGDVVAPHLPTYVREEAVVFVSALGAGVGALLAFARFRLPVLALFAALAGMATEFGRLSFQSLMQRLAPPDARGRVFVRYETVFQLAWVAGAFLPAVLGMSFRTGVLLMAAFYLLLGLSYLLRPFYARLRSTA